MRHLVAVALALVLVAVLPDLAHACAVCFDARDENRQAFLVTAGFLTVLPLGMVAGTGIWLRRRAKQVAAEEQGEGAREN